MTTSAERLRIRVEIPSVKAGPAYIRYREDWCGMWYTRKPQDAKTWKTRRGAERWLAGYVGITGTVESVTVK